jgi:hypothetical protein
MNRWLFSLRFWRARTHLRVGETSALIFFFSPRCVSKRWVEDWVLLWGSQCAVGLGIGSRLFLECCFISELIYVYKILIMGSTLEGVQRMPGAAVSGCKSYYCWP